MLHELTVEGVRIILGCEKAVDMLCSRLDGREYILRSVDRDDRTPEEKAEALRLVGQLLD